MYVTKMLDLDGIRLQYRISCERSNVGSWTASDAVTLPRVKGDPDADCHLLGATSREIFNCKAMMRSQTNITFASRLFPPIKTKDLIFHHFCALKFYIFGQFWCPKLCSCDRASRWHSRSLLPPPINH